jgi:modulator of FtsH protease HflC
VSDFFKFSNPLKSWSFRVACAMVLFGEVFITVSERQQAIIVQLGNPKRIIKEPGLHLKLPFIQRVIYFDQRLLSYDLPPQKIAVGDQKFLIVDVYTRYIITDPLVFYKSAGSELKVQQRLSSLIVGGIHKALGKIELSKLLSKERSSIISNIYNKVKEDSKAFGIDVIDVRISKTDLPKENSEAIFARMISERSMEAKQIRAEGEQKATEIVSQVDKECSIMFSEAKRKAQVLIGEGKAEAIKIKKNAYEKNKDLVSFMMAMETYKEGLKSGSSLLLSSDTEFMKRFFKND